MVQILDHFQPLRVNNFNQNLFRHKLKGTLIHVRSDRVIRQTICSTTNSCIQVYNQSEQTNRRSANYQPSSWSHVLADWIDEKDTECEIQTKTLKKLEEQVSYMLNDENLKPQILLELINDIDQLGLSYKYRESIKSALDRLSHLEKASKDVTKNLHASALYFRLLRQHGFEVSPDVFEKFKNESGNFNLSLAWDVQGMLSLYEASHLAHEGENILNEAKEFTRLHLEEPKEFINSNMQEQINHALEIPFHLRMRRLEARWRIESYAKRSDKNQVLLELADLDFNVVQSMLQSDLQELSRWWKAVGVSDKLSFARDRLMESFYWTVGMVFEPQFGQCSRGLTKVAAFITVLDDIYDVYGSLNELEQFTDAVVRWDLDAVNDLTDYMKLFFLALYNTVNEMAYDTLKEKGEIIIPHLAKAWGDICISFLKEAQWNYNKVTPTLDEYIENGWISSSGAVQLVHAYFLITENISKEAIQCLDHGILRWPCTIFRLYNDFGSSPAEIERGEITNAITCYMHETGLSEDIARQHISQMIEEYWKKMNKEIVISPSPFEENFTEISINLARIAKSHYQYGDAHSAPDAIAKYRIKSVILEPIQLKADKNNNTIDW